MGLKYYCVVPDECIRKSRNAFQIFDFYQMCSITSTEPVTSGLQVFPHPIISIFLYYLDLFYTSTQIVVENYSDSDAVFFSGKHDLW